MRIAGVRTQTPAGAEPNGQAVDQPADLFGFLNSAIEAFLHGLGSLGPHRRKTDDVKAVTGIERFCEGGEPLLQQPEQGFGVGQRPTGLNADPPDFAIDAEKRSLDFPRALDTLLQLPEKFIAQRMQHQLNTVHDNQGFGHAPLDHAGGYDASGGDRVVRISEKGIEAIDQPGAETRGKGSTGKHFDIADRAQSGPLQTGQMNILDLEADEAQPPQFFLERGILDHISR